MRRSSSGAEDHGNVDESNLFFGPYFRLEPGAYAIRFMGELEGPLRIRLAQKFASERLLERIVNSFRTPLRLTLTRPAEKFEIIGDRLDETRSMVLRSIEIVRETAVRAAPEEAAAAARAVAPPDAGPEVRRGLRGFVRDGRGRDLPLPLTVPAFAMQVHDAFGSADGNRLRAGAAIAFDAHSHGDVAEEVLFLGPALRFEPGEYSFRLRGALQGSLGLRVVAELGNRLRETVVESFDEPTTVRIESPTSGVEIIGLRTAATRAMTLASVEITVAPFQ